MGIIDWYFGALVVITHIEGCKFLSLLILFLDGRYRWSCIGSSLTGHGDDKAYTCQGLRWKVHCIWTWAVFTCLYLVVESKILHSFVQINYVSWMPELFLSCASPSDFHFYFLKNLRTSIKHILCPTSVIMQHIFDIHLHSASFPIGLLPGFDWRQQKNYSTWLPRTGT